MTCGLLTSNQGGIYTTYYRLAILGSSLWRPYWLAVWTMTSVHITNLISYALNYRLSLQCFWVLCGSVAGYCMVVRVVLLSLVEMKSFNEILLVH